MERTMKKCIARIRPPHVRYCLIIVAVLLFFPRIVDAKIFSPGETLDPDCLPTDPTCAVATTTPSTGITGVLGISRGGTGNSTIPAFGQLLGGDGAGNYYFFTTSSLALLTSAVGEYGNLYFTNARADARLNATSSLSTLLAAPALASVGTITTGVWNGTALTNPFVSDALAIDGGTINNTPIGATTPSTAVFTTATTTNLITTNATATNLTVNGAISLPVDSVGSSELAATAVSAGSYGSAAQAVTLTVDADGRLTNISTSSLSIDAGQITSGQLSIARGGTGWSNLAAGSVLLGNGGSSLATTTRSNLTETGSTVLTITGGSNAVLGSGTTIQVAQASASLSGFLSAANWGVFNNKISSSSLSAGTGISYNSATGVITNTGVTSLSGTANQITASGSTGALTLSLPSLLAFTNASSTQLSVFNKAYFGATATSSFSSAGVLTLASALTVGNGGTGVTSFNQGWLSSPGDGAAITASTSPTVNYITATSTTATSTFAGGINVTGGCIAMNGTCIRGSDIDRAHTDSGNDSNTSLSTAATTTILSLAITPTTAQGDVYISAQTFIVSGSNTDGTLIFAIRKTNCTGTVIAQSKVQVTVSNNTLVGSLQFNGTDIDPGTSAQTYALCGSAVTQSHDIRVSSLDLLVIDTGADVAELYTTNDTTLTVGDVVTFDPALTAGVKKSDQAYDPKVLGIISTKPALLVGNVPKEGVGAVPVALAGRVPVNVSTSNGSITAGDFLTSSAIPGVAMKATAPGPVIGQALAGYSGSEVGTVLVFVKNNYYSPSDQPPVSETAQALTDVFAEPSSSAIDYLTTKINQGLNVVKEFFAQKITAVLGVFERVQTNNLEMKDAATGEIYCLQIVNGDWQKTKGQCGTTASAPPPVISAEPAVAAEATEPVSSASADGESTVIAPSSTVAEPES